MPNLALFSWVVNLATRISLPTTRFVWPASYLQSAYDWDVTADLPQLTGFFAAVEARDSTQKVNADNETATAELMKMLQSR